MISPMRGLLKSAIAMLQVIYQYRHILVSITRVELAKRHAGSAFGILWIFLQPAFLLGIYLFVYMVVFRMRFPGYSQMDYVLFVFCGLIPYMGFMEAVNAGAVSVKQNIHLIKNVMLPIELIPVRSVMVSMVGQLVSIAIILILVIFNGNLSVHLTWLPLIILLQIMMLIGLVWILSALAVVLPDITYVVNLLVMFLMFVSPIGFKPDMVPEKVRFMIDWNPIYYLTEVYRDSLIFGNFPSFQVATIYTLLCIAMFALGAWFFRKFKGVLVDFE